MSPSWAARSGTQLARRQARLHVQRQADIYRSTTHTPDGGRICWSWARWRSQTFRTYGSRHMPTCAAAAGCRRVWSYTSSWTHTEHRRGRTALPANPGHGSKGRRLSAWEAHRITTSGTLTWRYECPLVTVVDPRSLRLMAHQWPIDLNSEHTGWPTAQGVRQLPRQSEVRGNVDVPPVTERARPVPLAG